MIRPLETLAYVVILSKVLFTAYVASQIVKVDVTPIVWAEVNQFDACALSNKSRHVPERASHSLRAKPGWSFSDNLQNEGKYIYILHLGKKTYFTIFLVGLERDYTSARKKACICKNQEWNFGHAGACFHDYFVAHEIGA